jgi:glycosyltransferase involved in cell wall biosynthesis
MKGARDSEFFTVGWIGSPSTAPYLQELIEPMSNLGKECAVRLIVIGGKAPKIPNVSVVEHEWHEHTELELINTFDVGVMPLADDDWARGKCAFKLIQYMACAVPVIASPVGANVDVVNKESGVLAATAQEWLEAFRLLRDMPVMRKNMGEAGRARVVQHYSLHQNVPKLAGVIHQVLGDA